MNLLKVLWQKDVEYTFSFKKILLSKLQSKEVEIEMNNNTFQHVNVIRK